MIAKSMEPFLAGSSVIRAMFEEGKKMAKVFGEENVYDFSVGNPGLHPPKEVKEAINYINNEMDPHVVHGYMANAGYESTRQAVADNLNKRYGSDFDMNNIIMTVGAGSALNVIMKTVFDPGDKQVVFAPYFVEYANWARNYGAETIVVPPNEANGFEPDPEALKAGSKGKDCYHQQPEQPDRCHLFQGDHSGNRRCSEGSGEGIRTPDLHPVR